MNWFPIVVLALAAFALAAFALRLDRRGWTLFGAVLVFGLAGYAMQGKPDLPSAPKQGIKVEARESGAAMVEARRALFNPDMPQTPYLTLSDGQARAGQFADAVEFLRDGVRQNPQHAEAWLAMANALVEHAEGQLTPASLYAHGKADAAAPNHPGVSYYLGVALLRSGRAAEARSVWGDMLANAPQDAPWKEELSVRLERLDAMLAQTGAQSQTQTVPQQPAQ